MVLVVDQGTIAESGTPAELLERDSYFRRLAVETGQLEEITEIANRDEVQS